LGVLYRVRQFALALGAQANGERVEDLPQFLDDQKQELFREMPPMDQHHCLAVFRALREAGHTDPSLLEAALLHDVGKTLGPVRVGHRVLAVLGKAFFPSVWNKVDGQPGTWRYPFSVHRRHAALGAKLAAEVGCAQDVVWLVAHHEDERRDVEPGDNMGGLLAALQAADQSN
jgi:putative nucleotidyltransferase with HDIG domain